MSGMVDPDDDAPEGYSRPIRAKLAKAPPPEKAEAKEAAVDDEALAKAAKQTTAAEPAAPDHGRPKGAGNALAFHEWKKKPPT